MVADSGPMVTTGDPMDTTGGETSSGAETSGGESSTTDEVVPGSCEDRYGEAEDFILCEQTELECRFFARTSGNCGNLCSAFDGMCISAFHDVSNQCETASPLSCGSMQGTQICVCSR